MAQMKICSKCERKLPADKYHFFKTSREKDGLHYTCKECEGYKFSKPKIKVKEGFKICKCCGKELQNTIDFFCMSTLTKDKLTGNCRGCINKRHRELYIKKPREPKHIAQDGYKYCSKCGKELPLNMFSYENKNKDKLRCNCKECDKKRYHNYYFKNSEILKAKAKVNSSERHRKYYVQNIEKCKKARKIYFSNNKEKYRIYAQNRLSMKRKLPFTLTKKDWDECKNFFNSQCAYCGRPLKKLTQDHIIPVTKGGGYVRQNIIPACYSCNPSKSNSNMETWYRKQPFFSQQRLDKIYSWMGVKKDKQQLKFI